MVRASASLFLSFMAGFACAWLIVLVPESLPNKTLKAESLPTITSIMHRRQSSKGPGQANYHLMYDVALLPYRHKRDIVILEVGANKGDSLQLWAEYFSTPKAIFGMRYGISDSQMIAMCQEKNCDKIRIVDADQSKVSNLRKFINQTLGSSGAPSLLSDQRWADYGFDVIVDDGSHVPVHMLLTFLETWPHLKPGGMYVIEDIGFSYADSDAKIYGYKIVGGGLGKPPPGNLVEKFKQLADVVQRAHCHPSLDYTVFTEQIDRTVWDVQFVSGTIVLHKTTSEQRALLDDTALHSAIKPAMLQGGSIEVWKARLASEDRVWDSEDPKFNFA